MSFAGGLPTTISWEERKGEEEKQHEHRYPDEERRRRRRQRWQNERVPEEDDDQRKQQQHGRRVHLRLMSGCVTATGRRPLLSAEGATNIYATYSPVQYHVEKAKISACETTGTYCTQLAGHPPCYIWEDAFYLMTS